MQRFVHHPNDVTTEPVGTDFRWLPTGTPTAVTRPTGSPTAVTRSITRLISSQSTPMISRTLAAVPPTMVPPIMGMTYSHAGPAAVPPMTGITRQLLRAPRMSSPLSTARQLPMAEVMDSTSIAATMVTRSPPGVRRNASPSSSVEAPANVVPLSRSGSAATLPGPARGRALAPPPSVRRLDLGNVAVSVERALALEVAVERAVANQQESARRISNLENILHAERHTAEVQRQASARKLEGLEKVVRDVSGQLENLQGKASTSDSARVSVSTLQPDTTPQAGPRAADSPRASPIVRNLHGTFENQPVQRKVDAVNTIKGTPQTERAKLCKR